MRTDVIDQTLAMALHPAYDCETAKFSVETILNLSQSPKTHPYIVSREVVEKMLEICEQRHKMLSPQASLFQQEKKMEVTVLKYVAVPSLPCFFTGFSVLFSIHCHTHAHWHAHAHTRTNSGVILALYWP